MLLLLMIAATCSKAACCRCHAKPGCNTLMVQVRAKSGMAQHARLCIDGERQDVALGLIWKGGRQQLLHVVSAGAATLHTITTARSCSPTTNIACRCFCTVSTIGCLPVSVSHAPAICITAGGCCCNCGADQARPDSLIRTSLTSHARLLLLVLLLAGPKSPRQHHSWRHNKLWSDGPASNVAPPSPACQHQLLAAASPMAATAAAQQRRIQQVTHHRGHAQVVRQRRRRCHVKAAAPAAPAWPTDRCQA